MVTPLDLGLGFCGWKGYMLFIGLDRGMGRDIERALIAESFVIYWIHLRK